MRGWWLSNNTNVTKELIMAKNIHEKPYDESTRTKLELFRRYVRSWLPVFIQQNAPLIEIYDFFAGSGTDSISTPGSPLIILEEIKAHCAKLKDQNSRIEVLFNDADKSKISNLQINTDTKLKACAKENRAIFCDQKDPLSKCPMILRYSNSDFADFFPKIHSRMLMDSVPRLLFIDQYGVKYVTQEVFQKLVRLSRSDFLFFISSSYIKRFKDQKEFKTYLDTNQINFDGSSPYQTHRIVYDYYKSLIPISTKYYLGQFALKKNANIYGVIFGSQHPLGLRKFLDIAWQLDRHTGETNFDIDDDPIRKGQIRIDFSGDGTINQIKKLVVYENDLLGFLQPGRTNVDIYLFSIENGISIKKTNEILKSLEQDNKLRFEGVRPRKGAYYLDFEPKKRITIYSK